MDSFKPDDPLIIEAEARTRLNALNRAPYMAALCGIQALLFGIGLSLRNYLFHPYLWLGGNLLILALLLGVAAWLKKRPAASLRLFDAVLFLLGCLWGWEATVVMPFSPPRGHFNAFTIAADLLMSVLITLAVHPSAILAAGLPSAGLIAVLMFFDHDAPMIPYGLASFLLFSYWLSKRIRVGIFRSHYLILRNAQLHEQVQASLADKNRFLLGTAHDLRQPLQNLGLLLPSLPKASKAAASLRANLTSMRSLVEGLADLERLGQGLVKARQDSVALGPLFHSLQQRIGKARGFQAEGSSLRVKSDPVLLERLLSNLIHNALDYGQPPVSLRARQIQGRTVIEVGDRGPGLPAQAKAVLQGKAGAARRAQSSRKGLGIGLVISRTLADALGVEIRVIRGLKRGTHVIRLALPQ